MSLKKYVNGAWTDITSPKRYNNSSNAWLECDSVKAYKNNAWAEVWSSGVPFTYYYKASDYGTFRSVSCSGNSVSYDNSDSNSYVEFRSNTKYSGSVTITLKVSSAYNGKYLCVDNASYRGIYYSGETTPVGSCGKTIQLYSYYGTNTVTVTLYNDYIYFRLMGGTMSVTDVTINGKKVKFSM